MQEQSAAGKASKALLILQDPPGSAVASSASHRTDGLLLWLQGYELGLLTLLPSQDGFPESLLGLNQALFLPCSGFGVQRALFALFS